MREKGFPNKKETSSKNVKVAEFRGYFIRLGQWSIYTYRCARESDAHFIVLRKQKPQESITCCSTSIQLGHRKKSPEENSIMLLYQTTILKSQDFVDLKTCMYRPPILLSNLSPFHQFNNSMTPFYTLRHCTVPVISHIHSQFSPSCPRTSPHDIPQSCQDRPRTFSRSESTALHF